MCEDFFGSAVADSCNFSGLNERKSYIFHGKIFMGNHLNEFRFDRISDFPVSIDLELIRVIDCC